MKVNPISNTNFKAGIKLENKHLYAYRGWGMDWQFRKELDELNKKIAETNTAFWAYSTVFTVCNEKLDLSTEEEKETLDKENEKSAEMFKFIKESLGDSVSAVRFTNTSGSHAVCLANEGMLSLGMEKVLKKMPGATENAMKAELVFEINFKHPIAAKLSELFKNDKEKLASYSKILFVNAQLISGLEIDNPAELSELICNLMI